MLKAFSSSSIPLDLGRSPSTVSVAADHARPLNMQLKFINLIRQTVEIWDIPDVGPVDVSRIMAKVEQTFAMIGQRTDMLLTALRLS